MEVTEWKKNMYVNLLKEKRKLYTIKLAKKFDKDIFLTFMEEKFLKENIEEFVSGEENWLHLIWYDAWKGCDGKARD